MGTDWRFISDPKLPAAMNMAIDEAIALSFREKKIPTLRVYRWDAPALTIGSFQKMEADLSSSLRNNGIPVIRRITGGRALLHDREITYSVVADTNDPLFSGGIKKTFFAIAQGLLAGLRHLGVEAEVFVPREKVIQGPFCMTSLSWYEIAVSGKKLIGSAQKRWVDHFLQHGSLSLAPSLFEEQFQIETPLHLCKLLPKLPPFSEIERALREGFETAFGIQMKETSLTEEEKRMAHRLVSEKYLNKDWNENRGVAGAFRHA